MIKEIVSDGIYILKNRSKYSDLEVAKAKRINAERNLAALKQRLQQEDMALNMEKKNAIKDLNHVKQIKEELTGKNQDILNELDSHLDGNVGGKKL